jgi:hypothetical protein
MPLLRVDDISRMDPESRRSAAEPPRDPSHELARIRGRALERASNSEELALGLALELALTQARGAGGR